MKPSTLFIANPQAGGGRARRILAQVGQWLGENRLQGTLLETRERGHAEQLAAGAAALGHDRVVAIGGDGTFQEIVNGLLATQAGLPTPAAGVVPAGRGNDVARALGLPDDPMACLSVALGEELQQFDVAVAQAADGRARRFAAVGGAGFDAQVAHTMESQRRFWMRGEAGYVLATVNELRRYRNHAFRVTLRDDGGERVLDGRFLFIAFANGPYYGGGMRICPEARTDDGLLDVCMVGDLSRWAALKELPGIHRALHVRHPAVRIERVRSLRIEGESGARVHLDGESFGTLPVEIGVLPGALRVACSTIAGR